MTVATFLQTVLPAPVLTLLEDNEDSVLGDTYSEDHGLLTAPIMTRDVLEMSPVLHASQHGLLGKVLSIHDSNGSSEVSQKTTPLYINIDAPLSALVCGVQGSGKSHTVNTLLENALIRDEAKIGSLHTPLSGLVLHFGDGGRASLPCEAAALGSSSMSDVCPSTLPKVTVFVSGSSLNTMKHIYSRLGSNIVVEPLKFSEDELDAEAFRSMMAVGSSESIPLYMHTVLNILRDLGESFSFQAFENRLDACKKDMNPMQKGSLEQRMVLLKSFMHPKKAMKSSPPRFAAGQLTVIDLSDPFIDAAAAASLFEIVIRMFVRADTRGGKILVVDEAHKYLTKSASRLTKCIVTLIREQRHLGMRVVVSTQEPTVIPPVVLELCSIAILHRFASPAWFEHIQKHVPADLSSIEAFVRIVQLKTGEAIVLAPAGMYICGGVPTPFVRKYLMMKTRKRITRNLGRSVLAGGESS